MEMKSRQRLSNSLIVILPRVAERAGVARLLVRPLFGPSVATTLRRSYRIDGLWSCLCFDSPTMITAWSRHPESVSPDTRLVLRPTAAAGSLGPRNVFTQTLGLPKERPRVRSGRKPESRWQTDGLLSVRLP